MLKPNAIIVALGIVVASSLPISRFVHVARADVRRDDFHIEADLLQASAAGDTYRVRDLLDKGARLETRDAQTTWTPLMWAARGGHVATVKLLLARGARVNARSVGSPATYFPLAYGKSVAVKSNADASQTGADATAPTAMMPQSMFASANNGVTPLLLSAAGGYNLTAKLLLERGASINAQTSSGESALEAASFKGYLPLVETLLARGAKPNLANGRGQTPLVNAVMEGHAPVVKMLLAHGADPNATFNRHYRVLSLARYYGNADIARLLKRAGARPEAAIAKTGAKLPPPVQKPTPHAPAFSRPGAPAAMGSGIVILN